MIVRLVFFVVLLGLAPSVGGVSFAQGQDLSNPPAPPVIQTRFTCRLYLARLRAHSLEAERQSSTCFLSLTVAELRADGYTTFSHPGCHGSANLCTTPVRCAGARTRFLDAIQRRRDGIEQCRPSENDGEADTAFTEAEDLIADTVIRMFRSAAPYAVRSREIRALINRNINAAERFNREALRRADDVFDSFDSYPQPPPRAVVLVPNSSGSQGGGRTVSNARARCGEPTSYFRSRIGSISNSSNFWNPNAASDLNIGWQLLQNPSFINQLDSAANRWRSDLAVRHGSGYLNNELREYYQWSSCMRGL